MKSLILGRTCLGILDQFSYFNKYRIQSDKKNDKEVIWKCFKRLMFNHVFIQFPMMLFADWGLKKLGFRMDAESLPGISTILWQLAAFFIIEDFYFYWVHRLLHHKRIYKYVHKVHHNHAVPFGIAAEYAHPIETAVLGLGTILGPFCFARHLLTLWCWLVVRLWETIEDHSGYEIPWNPLNFIPFWGGAVHHDYHHKEFEGNYASVFTFWDWVFGTDIGFRASQKSKQKTGKTKWSDLIQKLGFADKSALLGEEMVKKQRFNSRKEK